METLKLILKIITTVLSVLSSYKFVYLIIGFFSKAKRFPKASAKRRYAVVTAARNEELVIGKLLESLNAQSYPKELYTLFVVADNCTDRTAEIARSHGATVYERFEPERARKGYALNFLFKQIERDYGIEAFDGYLFFDADNVVNSDYIEQMNNAFETGADAVVGYRNSKNFSQNFISAAYGMHFMRSTVSYHRPRSVLSLSTHIAGTGYLLSSALLADGWNFELLTEDTQATLSFVSRAKHIEYCEAAELYDEQPTKIGVMLRQRLRWSKGRLSCFLFSAGKLVKGIFTAKGERISCYDMLFYIIPYSLFTAASALVGALAAVTSKNVAALSFGWDTVGTLVLSAAAAYTGYILRGAVIVARERRHINCSTPKLLLYLLAWPWFDLTNIPITVACLFMHITWKPIKHDAVIDINDIENSK